MIEQSLFERLCADVLPVFRQLSRNERYAITLGGSHGKGLSDRNSDFDFRVYYEEAAGAPLWDAAMVDLKGFVEKWKALGVEIDGVWPRSFAEVDGQLDEWLAGKGSPVPMFWNVWGYNLLTDIYNQAIVEDPFGIIQSWKDRLKVYSDVLRDSIITRHAFSLRYWRNDYHYRNKVACKDAAFCASITSRLINDVMQVIFALNRFYFPCDGMNLIYSTKFPIKPERLEERVIEILYPPNNLNCLEQQYQGMLGLIDDVLALPEKET
jgi:hypothetical protein